MVCESVPSVIFPVEGTTSGSQKSSPWPQSKNPSGNKISSSSSTTMKIVYARKKRIQRQQTSREQQRKTKTMTKARQDKKQTTPEIRSIASATLPKGYQFAPLWLINCCEQTSTGTLALGYPLLGPSRHVRTYCCMPKCCPGSLCRDPFRHEYFRPLFRHPMAFPLVLGYDRSLVGVDAENSEVVIPSIMRYNLNQRSQIMYDLSRPLATPQQQRCRQSGT